MPQGAGQLQVFLNEREVPTINNVSERALRPSTIFRKVTNGFRAEWGAELYGAVQSGLATVGCTGCRPCVGTQIVSCDSAHIVPDTGRVHFSRTFVGEPGSPASLRHLSHCLGGLLASMRMLAWPGSFLSGRSLPPAQCEPDAKNECAKQHLGALRARLEGHSLLPAPASEELGQAPL